MQKPIKTTRNKISGECITNFHKEVPSKLQIQCKKVMFFFLSNDLQILQATQKTKINIT